MPLRAIFRFWLPLALTWLIMALEGPFLAAVIARLAAPKYNLAAYGVAFAFAILVEAPVIMLMSASTALVDSWSSFRRLWNFTLILNVGITLLMILILIPDVYVWITADLIGLEAEVARLTRYALFLLLPWPAAIGYRRFYQGLLIRAGLTRRVAYGTLIRLAFMSATALLLALSSNLAGAYVGATALTVGVCAEAAASRIMAVSTLRALRERERRSRGIAPEYREIVRFYTPLALTMILTLAAQPMVTFFMGQARYSLESLAVLPVIQSLVFLFRTPGISFQEAAIALLGEDRRRLYPVLCFTGLLALVTSLGLAVIAWTPLARIWLESVSGLSADLSAFAWTPIRILVLLPALAALLSLQRALLIDTRRTAPVTGATLVELGVIGAMLGLTVHGLDLTGATAAALSIMIGRIAGNLYLLPPCLPACRSARADLMASAGSVSIFPRETKRR